MPARTIRRATSFTAALTACLALTLPAAAAPPTAEELTSWGQAIRGTDPAARAEAMASFAALGEDSLPALTARVAAARRERRTGEDGYRALGEFGRAAGASAPSEAVDVVPGIARVLDAGASAVHGRVAERLLLLRALERVGTARAVIAMLPILMTDMIAFRWEARHLVRRMGRVTVAALIRAASSPVPEVDVFAGWGFSALGIADAGHAVQDQTAESLAEIIRAYADVKHLGAMPMVASFVGDDRVVVREAARYGMLAYAENGIWQLRALHQSRLGRPSPAGMTFRDLLGRIEAHAEDRRAAPFRARMAEVEAAFARGHIDAASRLAADVEARASGLSDLSRLAPMHAARGAKALEQGDLDAAAEAYRRALLLAPTASEAGAWTSRLGEIETARLARTGIEPWPDAAILEAAHEEPESPRLPIALGLAAVGLALLSGPRVVRRVRLPNVPMHRIMRALRALRARMAPRVPVPATATAHEEVPLIEAPEEARPEEMPMPMISTREEAITPSTREEALLVVPAEDPAKAARERLAAAAAAARARLSSVPPPARASTEDAIDEEDAAHLVREAALRAEYARAEAEAREEAAREAEIARALEAEVARALEEEERARASLPETQPEPQARKPRPMRRASLSPDLFFGAAAPKKRSQGSAS